LWGCTHCRTLTAALLPERRALTTPTPIPTRLRPPPQSTRIHVQYTTNRSLTQSKSMPHRGQDTAGPSGHQERPQQQPEPGRQQQHTQQPLNGTSTAHQPEAGPSVRYGSTEDFSGKVEIYRGRHSVVWNVVCKATKRPLILKGYMKVRTGWVVCCERLEQEIGICALEAATGQLPNPALPNLHPSHAQTTGQDDGAQLPPGSARDPPDAAD